MNVLVYGVFVEKSWCVYLVAYDDGDEEKNNLVRLGTNIDAPG